MVLLLLPTCYLESLHLTKLSVFEIGPSSFWNTEQFEINSLPNLQSITIGDESFNGAIQDHSSFQIANCGKIESVIIPNSSFLFYRSFTIRNCSKLTTIIIGNPESTSSSFYLSDLSIEGNSMFAIGHRSTDVTATGAGRRFILSGKSNIIAK